MTWHTLGDRICAIGYPSASCVHSCTPPSGDGCGVASDPALCGSSLAKQPLRVPFSLSNSFHAGLLAFLALLRGEMSAHAAFSSALHQYMRHSYTHELAMH